MRKVSTLVIFTVLISSIALPYFPGIASPTSEQVPKIRMGISGDIAGKFNWDSPVATGGFAWAYAYNTLEPLFSVPSGWLGDYRDLIPVLGTEMELFYWPEEMNYHPIEPFINRNGIMAAEVTLREGVKFHDGSDFNATVVKWNIDRSIVIAGNITGKMTGFDADIYKTRYGMWLEAEEWVDFETDSWNISQFIGQPATYSDYGSSTDEALIGYYSRIKNVTILDDRESGGKIRINFNDWGGANSQMEYIYAQYMASMDAYKDYFDLPIYGLGGLAEFPQPDITGTPDDYSSTGFPGHMIGTGPYIYVRHDAVVIQGGSMIRNPNWWNSSAAQAEGWHLIPEIGFATFDLGETGITARNLAMVTGQIDLTYDSRGDGNLVYDDMIAEPNINYIEGGLEATRTFILMNAVNETYWKTFADLSPHIVNGADENGVIGDKTWMLDVDDDGTIHVDGINRALRKALSFAYDYDTYINVVRQGRAVQSGGFLGIENEFYNPDIPIPYTNLTIARQALIDDLDWGPIVASKNLDINNSTDDWIWVANNDPIFEIKMMWDMANWASVNLFSTSIKNIGMTLGGENGAPDPLLEIQPYLYVAMYFQPQSFPFLTYHAVPTNWGDQNVGNLVMLEYYYKSTGLPYENYSGTAFPARSYLNMGFHYNATVDKWLNEGWFANRTTQQELMDKLTTHFQTYQHDSIYISHNNWGIAANKEWILDNQTWTDLGVYAITFIRHESTQIGGGIQIPGFHTAALLAFAILTISGMGYFLKKKKKLALK